MNTEQVNPLTIKANQAKDKIMANKAKAKAMDTCQLNGVLGFLKEAEQLKNTLRTSYTSQGRHESTAEHSWRLCLMALVLETQFAPINIEKLLKLCTVHDLGEAIHGDIAAVDQTEDVNKNINERKDLVQLATPLPRQLQKTITDLWDEYEKGETKEAKVAKALDKLETLLQHTQAGKKQTIDYKFNLDYGKKYTDFDPVTRQLRAIIDIDTKKLAQTDE